MFWNELKLMFVYIYSLCSRERFAFARNHCDLVEFTKFGKKNFDLLTEGVCFKKGIKITITFKKGFYEILISQKKSTNKKSYTKKKEISTDS